MATTLTVVIPTQDRPESLTEALESLANQRLGQELQVIVVNDGGGDIHGVVDKYRATFGVEVINLPDNTGPSVARNAGIESAEGRYLAFLDDDDVLLPGHFQAILKRLEQGDVDFVYTTSMVSTVRAPAGMSHESGGWPAFDVPFDPEFLHVTNFIPPVGVTLRSPRARGARFDRTLRCCEDWDFWLSLLNQYDYRFAHLERASGVYHRVPRYDKAPDPPKETARVLRMFFDAHMRIFKSLPRPAGSHVQVSREYVRQMYGLAFARLETGNVLPAFWYERMVRLVHAEFVGELSSDEIRRELELAMNAEHQRGAGTRGTAVPE